MLLDRVADQLRLLGGGRIGIINELDVVLLGGCLGPLADDVPERVTGLPVRDHGHLHLPVRQAGRRAEDRCRERKATGYRHRPNMLHEFPPKCFISENREGNDLPLLDWCQR